MKFEFNVKNLSTEEIERLESVRSEFVNRKRQLINKNSKAESHFEKLLNDAHIYHEREKCFYDCKGEWCYIDFYIPLYHLAIEIDGKEHRTQKQSFRDKNKEEFLTYNRNIATVRITNEQCLAMKQINLADFVYHPKVKQSISVRIKSLFRHEGEHNTIYEKNGIEYKRKVFVYNKMNGVTYNFKSPYSFHMSLGCNYEQFCAIMANIANPFIHPKFIIGYTEKELEYYKSIYYANNGIQPDNFVPIRISNETLPSPIFSNYQKRKFLVVIQVSKAETKFNGLFRLMCFTVIDIYTMETVYIKIKKCYSWHYNGGELGFLHDFLAHELMSVPFNSDVCIVTFRNMYYNYIKERRYRKAVEYGHLDISNIIKGRGIALTVRMGEKVDYKYGSIKQIYRAACKIRNSAKPTFREFESIIDNYLHVNITENGIINLYNFIDKNGWSDKCNLKNQDFALFMELRIIEYKRIYGSIS